MTQDEGRGECCTPGTQICSGPQSNAGAPSGSKTSKPEVNCLNQA
jgi:hypothetical protein